MKTKDSSLVVGLTGGIASGKTTVANYLETLGAYLIDTDIISRQVLEPGSATTDAVRKLLGDEFFHSNGTLHRAKVKQLIFANQQIKNQYESIVLTDIRRKTLLALENSPQNVPYVLLIVPLLFEKGLDQYTNLNIVVDVPTDIQISRGIARNPSDNEVIYRIIEQQMTRKERNAQADFIINNNQPLKHLFGELDSLHQTLCNSDTSEVKKND